MCLLFVANNRTNINKDGYLKMYSLLSLFLLPAVHRLPYYYYLRRKEDTSNNMLVLGHIGIDILCSCLSDQKKTSAEGAPDQLSITNIYVCILLLIPLWSYLPFLHFVCVVVVVVDNENKIIIIIIIVVIILFFTT
jgi:hypothetical protein